MKVAILGSNSFAAQDFIDLLLDNGENSIIGFSQSTEKPLFLKYKKNKNLQNFKFYRLGVSGEESLLKLEAILDNFQPEYIINFISLIDIPKSWKQPLEYFDVHVVCLHKIVSILKGKSYLKLFIQTSSQAIYGLNKGEINMKTCPRPSTPYGISKLSADLYLQAINQLNITLPFIIMRLTNFYGEYQKPNKILAKTVFAIKENQLLPLHGGGGAVLSYIHVRDVSYAILKALKNATHGRVYFIGPEETITLKNLISKIASEFNLSLDDISYNTNQRAGQSMDQWLNIEKTKNDLDWGVSITLESGIKKTISWILDNYKELEDEKKKS